MQIGVLTNSSYDTIRMDTDLPYTYGGGAILHPTYSN